MLKSDLIKVGKAVLLAILVLSISAFGVLMIDSGHKRHYVTLKYMETHHCVPAPVVSNWNANAYNCDNGIWTDTELHELANGGG